MRVKLSPVLMQYCSIQHADRRRDEGKQYILQHHGSCPSHFGSHSSSASALPNAKKDIVGGNQAERSLLNAEVFIVYLTGLSFENKT